jgi:hypothetical protein
MFPQMIKGLRKLFKVSKAGVKTSKSITIKKSMCFLLLLHPLLVVTCGFDLEDPTPPDQPEWSQKSLPEEWPERGIDAHESGGICLEWENNISQQIVSYEIFRATHNDAVDSIDVFDLIAFLNTETLNENIYIDLNVIIGQQYSYKIRCEDSAGNFSTLSEEITYSLLTRISSLRMEPNGLSIALGANRELSWLYVNEIAMENYCLTILNMQNGLVVRVQLLPTNYTNGEEFWNIPDSVSLEPNGIYKWRVDVAASYINGFETAGSESPWASFRYVYD